MHRAMTLFRSLQVRPSPSNLWSPPYGLICAPYIPRGCGLELSVRVPGTVLGFDAWASWRDVAKALLLSTRGIRGAQATLMFRRGG